MINIAERKRQEVHIIGNKKDALEKGKVWEQEMNFQVESKAVWKFHSNRICGWKYRLTKPIHVSTTCLRFQSC